MSSTTQSSESSISLLISQIVYSQADCDNHLVLCINLPVIFKLMLSFIESPLSLLCSIVKSRTVLPKPITHEYNIKHSHTCDFNSFSCSPAVTTICSKSEKHSPYSHILTSDPMTHWHYFVKLLMLRQNYINMFG